MQWFGQVNADAVGESKAKSIGIRIKNITGQEYQGLISIDPNERLESQSSSAWRKEEARLVQTPTRTKQCNSLDACEVGGVIAKAAVGFLDDQRVHARTSKKERACRIAGRLGFEQEVKYATCSLVRCDPVPLVEAV